MALQCVYVTGCHAFATCFAYAPSLNLPSAADSNRIYRSNFVGVTNTSLSSSAFSGESQRLRNLSTVCSSKSNHPARLNSSIAAAAASLSTRNHASGRLSRSSNSGCSMPCTSTIRRRVRCSAGGEGEETEKGKEGQKQGPSISTATEEPGPEDVSSSKITPEVGGGDGPPPGKGQNPKGVQLDTYSLFELLGPEKVDQEDVKLLKDKLFGYTTYWVTGQEPFGDSGEGVLLLGNLRGQREEVYARLLKGVKELTGDKYDLFMIEEPNAEEDDPRGGPRVSFVLLRKEASVGAPTSVWQYIIAIILGLLTAGACLELGLASQVSKLPPDVVAYFSAVNPDELEPPELQVLVPFVRNALPLAYGVFGVQIFHEVGHRLVAAQKKVRMSIPFLVPNITIGSFGAVTQFKSTCPDRSAKFDISVAGPLAGGALSLAMFTVGLALSASPEAQEQLVQVPSVLFQGSFALGLATRVALGYDAMHAAVVGLHPLVIAGWCGLTTTAFNSLPVGCIDGGRAMQAAFGKKALSVSSLVTYLLLGLGVLGGTLSLPWGLYILIVQRNQEKPALNDVTGVGPWRQGVLVATITLAVMALLPIWDELAADLGIGLATPLL
eukprot:jgi/Mesen1/1574/ME000134S00689